MPAVDGQPSAAQFGDGAADGDAEAGAVTVAGEGGVTYGAPWVQPAGFNLHLNVDDAQKWWDRAVAAGCEVTMPLEKQFWGDIYGQLKDPYGITWAIGQSTSDSMA